MGQTTNLPEGFRRHGAATSVGFHRGLVATVDGAGRNVVLLWLYDHRGGYALRSIDAETGDSTQLPMPFDNAGDCPFASILSSRNRFYTHFGSHFVEYDPAGGEFTFTQKTAPRTAMAMAEDDHGVVWSATYPDCGLVSYDPASGEFQDYGSLNDEDWAQYPRHLVVDDAGWVYLAIGPTTGHVIALDPGTHQPKPMLSPDERQAGHAVVHRAMDGKVYGRPGAGDAPWYVFHQGQARQLDGKPSFEPVQQIAGSQGLMHGTFPNGERLVECDLTERTMTVEDPGSGETRAIDFEFTTEGPLVMSLAAGPGGTVWGRDRLPYAPLHVRPSHRRMVGSPRVSPMERPDRRRRATVHRGLSLRCAPTMGPRPALDRYRAGQPRLQPAHPGHRRAARLPHP